MNIIQDFIPRDTAHNRRPGRVYPKKYIVVHNNANENSTAKNERGWLVNKHNKRTASWNFAVDDKDIIEAIPRTEMTWNAGDGSKGEGNLHGISIEICEKGGVEAERLAIELIAYLMVTHDIPLNMVKPHRFFSGKNCPRKILPRWKAFLKDVEREYDRLATPKEEKVAVKDHWGIKQREKLIARGVDISEERYDDNITRAESMALSNKTLDAVEKLVERMIEESKGL